MAVYEASRLTEGNRIFPNKIEIDWDGNVTYYKGSVFGYKETHISHDSIGSVSLSAGLIFCTIKIETCGGKVITAEGFTRGDAEDVKVEIMRNRSSSSSHLSWL